MLILCFFAMNTKHMCKINGRLLRHTLDIHIYPIYYVSLYCLVLLTKNLGSAFVITDPQNKRR